MAAKEASHFGSMYSSVKYGEKEYILHKMLK
jgi:hypothetical protein